MLIRTSADLGAVLRERRKKLGLNQADLAARIGVSRQWILGVEKGHVRAELGLVLRVLNELGIRLDAKPVEPGRTPSPGPDIDAIIAAARKSRP